MLMMNIYTAVQRQATRKWYTVYTAESERKKSLKYKV